MKTKEKEKDGQEFQSVGSSTSNILLKTWKKSITNIYPLRFYTPFKVLIKYVVRDKTSVSLKDIYDYRERHNQIFQDKLIESLSLPIDRPIPFLNKKTTGTGKKTRFGVVVVLDSFGTYPPDVLWLSLEESKGCSHFFLYGVSWHKGVGSGVESPFWVFAWFRGISRCRWTFEFTLTGNQSEWLESVRRSVGPSSTSVSRLSVGRYGPGPSPVPESCFRLKSYRVVTPGVSSCWRSQGKRNTLVVGRT